MDLRSVFEWLDVNLPGSVFLRESAFAFAYLLTAHVLGICLFAGLVIMMDLRLVGIGNRRTSFSELQKALFPWQMAGMALAAFSGFMLFYAQPMRYYGKGFFWVKMGLMALAGVNALSFHLTTYRSIAAWDASDRRTLVPFAARLAGVLSLVLWAGIVLSGRLVAFDWWTYK